MNIRDIYNKNKGKDITDICGEWDLDIKKKENDNEHRMRKNK